ncbi:hypothetical protein TraAM80_07625 [Trypanosoma rangeli]|uniref:Uncharacterized protein n=1 Tax=Trypanosoma rangeli TaxID=5698 RepID=A0A3R7MD78_TRYRA|nr:uncharacterized protein TraAM80_07625 [Trypanosoma rangeli]RNF00446.1 hypothetical protein TraAM80_07625 [Trypanosoma rangeli]|eukprot:RNF00446.1 hypothetical protein TraAM80_07625 [Trypanosoma rangeli]
MGEKRVAAQKLKNNRERIFRSNHTDNLRLVLPHIAALAWSWYSLCIPAQQLGELVGVTAVAPSRMSVCVLGFNDGLDAWVRQAKRNMTLTCVVLVAGTLLGQCCAGPAFVSYLLPPQLAPVWLGISVMSSCKSLLVNHYCSYAGAFWHPGLPADAQHARGFSHGRGTRIQTGVYGRGRGGAAGDVAETKKGSGLRVQHAAPPHFKAHWPL